MLKPLDRLLNRITMYRLVLYYLIFLLAAAFLLSGLGILSYDPVNLLFSIGFLIAVCWAVNWIFARTFGVAPNVESVYITALVLALIINPITSPRDLWFLGWAGVIAMASKYIVAIGRKHVFNPAAFAVAITYITLNKSASWWVGAGTMLPFVLLGGLLVVRKIERGRMVLSFLITATLVSLGASLLAGAGLVDTLRRLFLSSPLFFFAFIILSEPLTAPPTQATRLGYGILTGILFAPQVHFGPIYFTPETAILIGNIYSYMISPKTRTILRLKEKNKIAPDIYDFIFTRGRYFAFAPGQYMEWTLGHTHPDGRGNRRFFTLASAPTEKTLRLGVRIDQHSSSFKRALLQMNPGDEIIAGQVAGDFVLPRNRRQKIVLIAGGVGVTPFRSMIRYLLDRQEPRPITLFYSSRTPQQIVYRDVFDRARKELGIQTVYAVDEPDGLGPSWTGVTGRITPELIQQKVPDYRQCLFYVSGPKGMVDSFKEILAQMDVPASQVKTDFFQGLA